MEIIFSSFLRAFQHGSSRLILNLKVLFKPKNCHSCLIFFEVGMRNPKFWTFWSKHSFNLISRNENVNQHEIVQLSLKIDLLSTNYVLYLWVCLNILLHCSLSPIYNMQFHPYPSSKVKIYIYWPLDQHAVKL